MDQEKSSLQKFTASPLFRVGLGFLLSGIALYLALRNVDFQDVGTTLKRADVWYVGLALMSVALNNVGKGIRWHILLGTAGQAVPFRKILAMHLVGQMLNNLFPLRAGDVTRAYVIGGMGPGRVFVLGTVVLEKFLDMISYVVLFFGLLLLIPLPAWMSDSVLSLLLVVLVMIGGVILLIHRREWFLALAEWFFRWLPAHLQDSSRNRLNAGLSSLEILQSRQDRNWLLIWTMIIWGTAVLNNYLVLFALHVSVSAPLIAALLVLVVLQIGISLPSAPGTIGIFQYGCVVALALFGINQATAFSYGILLHAIVMVPTILIGALLFWTMGISRKKDKG
jgi:hypothetical protein